MPLTEHRRTKPRATEQSDAVGDVVGDEIGAKGGDAVVGEALGENRARGSEASQAGDDQPRHGTGEGNREEQKERSEKLASRAFGPRADLSAEGKRDSQHHPNPPSSGNAPIEPQESRSLGANGNRNMSDGEVLKANTGGNLVMHNAVSA